MALGRQAAPHIAGPKLQQGFAIVSGVVAAGMAAHAATWI
jgi:hypothetical protein